MNSVSGRAKNVMLGLPQSHSTAEAQRALRKRREEERGKSFLTLSLRFLSALCASAVKWLTQIVALLFVHYPISYVKHTGHTFRN